MFAANNTYALPAIRNDGVRRTRPTIAALGRLSVRSARVSLAPSLERVSNSDQQHAEHQEADVPRSLVRAATDVMDAEDVMVDDAFDHVEQSPTNEDPSPQGACGEHFSPICRDA